MSELENDTMLSMHNACLHVESFYIQKIVALQELVDGAYNIVELWKAKTPSQQNWKDEWMTKASRHVTVSFP